MPYRRRRFRKDRGMRDYFFALLAASVFGSLCAAFAGSRFEKQMRFVAALCLLAAAVFPLKQIVPAVKDFAASAGEYSAPEVSRYAISETEAESAAKEYVSGLLYGEFGIKPLDVSIDIVWEGDTPQVGYVRVLLPAGADTAAANEFLQSRIGGETEVVGE